MGGGEGGEGFKNIYIVLYSEAILKFWCCYRTVDFAIDVSQNGGLHTSANVSYYDLVSQVLHDKYERNKNQCFAITV